MKDPSILSNTKFLSQVTGDHVSSGDSGLDQTAKESKVSQLNFDNKSGTDIYLQNFCHCLLDNLINSELTAGAPFQVCHFKKIFEKVEHCLTFGI